jgi:hypothetical protein
LRKWVDSADYWGQPQSDPEGETIVQLSDQELLPTRPFVTDKSKQILNDQIIKIRKLVQTRLARYSRLDPADCKEVYLFQADHFCGVRFSLGSFEADWRIDQTEIGFSRDGNQIDRVSIDGTGSKRAA